jgi:ABC-type branched-subunit amino acid transport system ATPase component
VTVLEAGVVIFNGTPDDARVDPSVRRAYLG